MDSFGKLRAHAPQLLAIAAALLAIFLSTYHLTESPPVWFDEGHLIQVSLNIVSHAPNAAIQVAPGVFESGAYSETSGFPLTYPIASAFSLFGTSLLAARSVMVGFILLFLWCAWRLARREMPYAEAAASLALLASFAPLYGNGKNVLGEVPGLFFLAAFLLFVKRIESGKASFVSFAFAGLMLGLAIAAKPLFLLALLPTAAVLLFSRKLLSPAKVAVGALAFLIPAGIWLSVQWGGTPLPDIIAFYANPFHIDLMSTVAHNARLMLTSAQGLYALALIGAWTLALLVRIRRKEAVSKAEWIAFGFSALTYLAFLRMAPYFRYFFAGEVLALLYLPRALMTLASTRLRVRAVLALIALLVAFQVYQCFASSWVAQFYAAHRTRDLSAAVGTLPPSRSIFIYNAPEAVLFLPTGMPYYQYFFATPIVSIGESQVTAIAAGVPDYVLYELDSLEPPDLSAYKEKGTYDRYVLMEKRTPSRTR